MYNTKYFQNYVKIGQHKNRINSIKDNVGNIFTNFLHIESCFLNFYKNLWSSNMHVSLDYLLAIMPDDFTTISTEDRIFLTKPVSKGVVFKALRAHLD